ncbi:MAG TPA: hypothetical protein VGC04_07340 [Cellulomonas sp.]
MTDALLAVDAGNSKTIAVVVDPAGAVLGRGRGGRGDIYGAASAAEARAAVFAAARGALDEAGVAPGDVRAAAFRLAGVDWPEDRTGWEGWIDTELPGMRRRSVLNDGFATLRLGDPSGVGLGITVGTGPALAARSNDGQEACSGWWVFDDLGGAGIAHAALAAVHRSWMGLGPATCLTAELLELFDVPDPYELRHSFTRRFGARPESEQWAAARVVLAAAADGDDVARRIVEHQAAALVGYGRWVALQVGADLTDGHLPVVLNGSVATSEHGALREALLSELAVRYPGTPVRVAGGAPLAGCVLDAIAESGRPVDGPLVAHVVATIRAEDFPAA